MIVVVASQNLWPTPALASTILSIIISTDEDIGVRYRGEQATSSIEEMAYRISKRVNRSTTTWTADPAGGSSAGFRRDNHMVKDANHVYAFFAPGEEMEGGTGHVVEVALRCGVPVTAYHLDRDGNVVEFASEGGPA